MEISCPSRFLSRFFGIFRAAFGRQPIAGSASSNSLSKWLSVIRCRARPLSFLVYVRSVENARWGLRRRMSAPCNDCISRRSPLAGNGGFYESDAKSQEGFPVASRDHPLADLSDGDFPVFSASRVVIRRMDEIQIHGSSEPYVKTEELAVILRVRPDTIVDWSKRYPDFPALRLPGVLRMRVSEVERWLKQFNPAATLGAT